MIQNLKPIPRAIVIAIIVGGLGYAASKFIPDSKPAENLAPQTEVTSVPTEQAAPPTQEVQQQVATPQPSVPETMAPTPIAPGLSAVIEAGNK